MHSARDANPPSLGEGNGLSAAHRAHRELSHCSDSRVLTGAIRSGRVQESTGSKTPGLKILFAKMCRKPYRWAGGRLQVPSILSFCLNSSQFPKSGWSLLFLRVGTSHWIVLLLHRFKWLWRSHLAADLKNCNWSSRIFPWILCIGTKLFCFQWSPWYGWRAKCNLLSLIN